MTEIENSNVLVDQDWVAQHLDDPSVRLVCCDRSVDRLETPLVSGSIVWSWSAEMQQPNLHDIPDKKMMESLLCRFGITNDTTVVLYGGANSWYAAFGFWLLKIYGHRDIRIMPGGIQRWSKGEKPTDADPLIPELSQYNAVDPDWSFRANRDDVGQAVGNTNCVLLDVRSPPEFNGEVFAPGTPTKFGERAGRIPGAVNVSCNSAVNEDGTFKSANDLRALFNDIGITPDKAVIVYCTIGARSAQSWFVLSQLLGYPNARLYDGSWGEWGNLIGVPIET